MQRTIKFRAWDKKQKRFTSDGIYLHVGGSACVFDDDDGGKSGLWEHEITRDFDLEIMQFTGLLDKNGKEIWEGDIVRTRSRETGKVIFTPPFFQVEGLIEVWIQWPTDYFEEVEVIGNIWENSNLWEKK